ncbi:MAG: hypothetical protein MJ114_02425 [Acetatifactor sp.]|nr:hypothetical protein [Acetatifactor sp.]
MNTKKWNGELISYGILSAGTLLLVYYLLHVLCGFSLMDANAYNTFALQADSWRQGRLHLGQDYPWLELAIYKDQFFCSFPPFPSYVLFPLTFLFGSNTPDGVIALAFSVAAVLGLMKAGVKIGLSGRDACILSLSFTVATNFMFVFFNPAVWFFAQTICFSVSVLAILAALHGKTGLSLFLWSCGVGCRPMQVLYLPVLVAILYRYYREEKQENLFLVSIRKWYTLLPCGAVALSYMILNYLRFGKITEFGHNYLPEFMYIHKQFSPEYLQDNLRSLFHMPQIGEDGRLVIDHFGNCNILLVNPAVILFICLMIVALFRFGKNKKELLSSALVYLCTVVYMIVTMMHATMGGWQFGNRYFIDCLPWIFYGTAVLLSRQEKMVKGLIPIGVWGLLFNLYGTIVVYCNY